MTEAEWWDTSSHPNQMLTWLEDIASDRKFRLVASECWLLNKRPVLTGLERKISDILVGVADGVLTESEVRQLRDDALAWALEHFAKVYPDAADLPLRRIYESNATYAVDWSLKPNAFVVADWLVQDLEPQINEPVRSALLAVLRDIFGNPFRTVAFDPEWRTSTAVALAQGMYDTRDFSPMPILADALQDAGCDSEDVLDHCRGPGPHVRGCWVVDLVLGKE